MDDVGRGTRGTASPRIRVGLLLLAAGLLSVGLASFVARAPPPIPMTTQGNAYDESGSPLPPGTLIRTFVDGVDYSNDTSVFNAQGGFSVLTNGSLVLNATTPEPSPVKTGASAGEPVVFAAGPLTTRTDFFQEVLPWHTDLTVTQDLHLGSAATMPEPIRLQGVVTQPARGGPQYVVLCNPTTSSVSLADYYLQVDRPGTFYGGNFTLAGAIPGDAEMTVNLISPFALIPSGDALKLVYRNPGGPGAAAGGRDLVIDRLEFNAVANGTLDWQPGNTTLRNAPAPGPGQILERFPVCSASPAPDAFRLATEPGQPPSAPLTVTILSPTPGQNVPGGQAFTIRWNLSDPVFIAAYLHVWANVTVGGTTTTLLAGSAGATSVDWSVPDASVSGATVAVTAINPFGTRGSGVATFNILPATPYSLYLAVLLIVVVAVFILVGVYYARRERPSAPPAAAGPPAVPPAAPGARVDVPSTAEPGTKACPRCGTAVKETDDSCFFCGHLFVKPPP